MKIFITGGLGFVGRHLSRFLLGKGHFVIATGTRTSPRLIDDDYFRYVLADTTQPGAWQKELNDVDIVINLAGKPIFNRWTSRYKKEMYQSRILTTKNVVEALPTGKKMTLCSASAVGYYGSRGDAILTESEPPGDDFLSEVAKDWEAEAFRAEEKGYRVVVVRLGVVLAKGGGAMDKMIPAYRSFTGGPIGNGKQWFSWIHMADVVSAIHFILETEKILGPVNLCSPQPVRNQKFARTLGRVLNRPAIIPAPAFMVQLVLGEFGSVLLASQRMKPEKLLQHGFTFQYPDLEDALKNIVGH